MSEFTKGKWVWDEETGYINSHRGNEDFIVAYVTSAANNFDNGCSPKLRAELETNARLIAAAPEMYELLKVWTELQVQPDLMNARKRARELLALIDEEEVKGDEHIALS